MNAYDCYNRVRNELDKLKIPYEEDGHTLWCPKPVTQMQDGIPVFKIYKEIEFTEFILGYSFRHSIKITDSGWFDNSEADFHEMLVCILNFYYNNIES